MDLKWTIVAGIAISIGASTASYFSSVAAQVPVNEAKAEGTSKDVAAIKAELKVVNNKLARLPVAESSIRANKELVGYRLEAMQSEINIMRSAMQNMDANIEKILIHVLQKEPK